MKRYFVLPYLLAVCMIAGSCSQNAARSNMASSKDDKKLHIPSKMVESTVMSYFNISKLQIEKSSFYSSKEEEYITDDFEGFGGGQNAKIIQKARLSDDIIKLTVNIYGGEEYNPANFMYRKIYTIEESKNGYQYLSIIKQS